MKFISHKMRLWSKGRSPCTWSQRWQAISQERRILFGDVAYRDYRVVVYPQPKKKEKDLDIAAINGGDFKLSWTWRNGKGLRSSSKQMGKSNKVASRPLRICDKKSKIPYVENKDGETGAAIGLLKIGFQNPYISPTPASHVWCSLHLQVTTQLINISTVNKKEIKPYQL